MMEFKGTKGKWIFFKGDEFKTSSLKIGGAHEIELEINGKNRINEEIANGLLISKAPEMLDFINRVSGEMLRNDFVLSEEWWEQAVQLIKEATEL